MQTDFVVQTDTFEGPLDTLLSLIEERKLYINDISLAKVTGDYVQFITNHQETIGNKTEFVSIASTLVLAKSKSLLPDETSQEDQDEIDELEDRLRAYKLMKARGEMLADEFGQQPLFAPESTPEVDEAEYFFAPGGNLTPELLADQAKKSIVSLPEDSLPTANIEKTVSLKEEIARLEERCREAGKSSFSSMKRSDAKHDQVVLFVAILELVKTGSLEASQSETFSEIIIHSKV